MRCYTKFITTFIMVTVITTFSLTACGRSNDSSMNGDNTMDNNSGKNNESTINAETASYNNSTDNELIINRESSITETVNEESYKNNANNAYNNNTEETNSSQDGSNSGGDKIETEKPDPIELPFVPAY